MSIPNIIHFCFGMKEQKSPFILVHFLAVMSAKVVNNPEKIYMYYHYEPFGPLWDLLKPHIILEKVELPKMIGDKPILKTAHMADVVRMNKLLEIGGIYFDIDTISYRPYVDLLNNDCVLAWEARPWYICNAVMMTKPQSEFMKLWTYNYYKFFVSNGWGESSIRLPAVLYSIFPNIVNVLDSEYFFQPTHTEFRKIFVDDGVPISNNLITLHLWEQMCMDIVEKIDVQWLHENKHTLYSKLVMSNKELVDILDQLTNNRQ
jgi:hypothetical protein